MKKKNVFSVLSKDGQRIGLAVSGWAFWKEFDLGFPDRFSENMEMVLLNATGTTD